MVEYKKWQNKRNEKLSKYYFADLFSKNYVNIFIPVFSITESKYTQLINPYV